MAYSQRYVPHEGKRAKIERNVRRRLAEIAERLGVCHRHLQTQQESSGLPKWRPCGRESGGGLSPQAARPRGRLPTVMQGRALRALAACAAFAFHRFCRQERHGCRNGIERMEWMLCYRGVRAAERQSTECETLRNRAQAPVRARSVRRVTTPNSRPQGRHFGSTIHRFMKLVSYGRKRKDNENWFNCLPSWGT